MKYNIGDFVVAFSTINRPGNYYVAQIVSHDEHNRYQIKVRKVLDLGTREIHELAWYYVENLRLATKEEVEHIPIEVNDVVQFTNDMNQSYTINVIAIKDSDYISGKVIKTDFGNRGGIWTRLGNQHSSYSMTAFVHVLQPFNHLNEDREVKEVVDETVKFKIGDLVCLKHETETIISLVTNVNHLTFDHVVISTTSNSSLATIGKHRKGDVMNDYELIENAKINITLNSK